MELNYDKKYAYAEVDFILKWLGDEYTSKIPKKELRAIKNQKKFAFVPDIDFNKPIENQVRQETKNIIAYFTLNYWLTDEDEKKKLKDKIKENAEKDKLRRKAERMRQIQERAKVNSTTVTASIDNAFKKLNEDGEN